MTASLSIYPAIDLLDGRCVRLRQGAFDAVTTYSDDPVATAARFREAGATFLHLVDLSGARAPEARQTSAILDIVARSGLRVQTGGGLRTASGCTPARARPAWSGSTWQAHIAFSPPCCCATQMLPAG